MKPIFFPFTYVTEPTINACRSFFSGISVFQSSMKQVPEPLRQWANQGFLDILLPDADVSRTFDAMRVETENWARFHRGGMRSFLKGYQGKTPFFGPSSISQIKHEIKTAGQKKSHGESQDDAVLRARIFLQMAQEYDVHHQGLSHTMQQQDAMEKNLYRELKGDAHSIDIITDPGPSWDKDDPFEYMILDRLGAWSHVMLSQPNIQGPLVTTHASVMELIQTVLHDTEKLILAATLPVSKSHSTAASKAQQDLGDYCRNLVRTPGSKLKDSGLLDTYPAETPDKNSLELHLLPGIAPHHFMARFVDGTFQGLGNRDDTAGLHTLIGYIPMASGSP